MKALAGPQSLKVPGGGPFLSLLALTLAGSPWLSWLTAAPFHTVLVWLSVLCAHVSVSRSLLYGHQPLDLGPTLLWYDLIWTRLHLQTHQCRLEHTFKCTFLGDTRQPNRSCQASYFSVHFLKRCVLCFWLCERHLFFWADQNQLLRAGREAGQRSE